MNPIEQIRQCENQDELSALWSENCQAWQLLPIETGKEIIDEKNSRKKWLSFITDHPGQVEALEERAGILEFDGGLSRAEAEEKTMTIKLTNG